jgi:hypothetical protein
MAAVRLSPFSSAESNFLTATQETSSAAWLEKPIRMNYRRDKKRG